MQTPRALFIVLTLFVASSASRAGEKWKPLWDGKTFDGWHVIGQGEWKIIDGAIRATHAKQEKEFGHIVVLVNGIPSAELKDDPGRREGRFAFQVHGGQDCEVWFKDVEIMVE